MAVASSSRYDGRSTAELRPLTVKYGQLDRADGSGRFGFGSTAAIASMSGPMEVRLREELPDKATLEIVHRPLEGISATPSRAIVNTLQTIFPPLLNLGQHPRSLVQLVIQSLSAAPSINLHIAPVESSSSAKTWPVPSMPTDTNPTSNSAPISGSFFAARAALINAATLAILDGGAISLRAIPIAVSLVYLPRKNGEEVILDPTPQEESAASSRYVFAWAYGVGISSRGREGDMEVEGEEGESELVYVESEGQFSREQLEQAMDQGKIATRRILAFIREQLGEHLEKRIQR